MVLDDFRRSSNQDVVSFTNWKSGLPVRNVGQDNCVHTSDLLKWKVGLCSASHQALCQHPVYPGKVYRECGTYFFYMTLKTYFIEGPSVAI